MINNIQTRINVFHMFNKSKWRMWFYMPFQQNKLVHAHKFQEHWKKKKKIIPFFIA